MFNITSFGKSPSSTSRNESYKSRFNHSQRQFKDARYKRRRIYGKVRLLVNGLLCKSQILLTFLLAKKI